MKVIDLLNKIANGEEVPEHIKLISGIELYYCEDTLNYYNELGCNELFGSWIAYNLNDEIEIVEDKQEPKTITKKDLEAIGYAFCEMKKALQNGWDKSLKNEPFKEDKKIEKLSILTFSDLIDMPKEELVDVIKEQRFKINEIIDEVNKLKDDRK